MLTHLRLTVPTDLSDRIQELLLEDECVTNVTLHEGVVLQPPGNLIECDVAREEADKLLRRLDDAELDRHGGIVVETPTATPFAAARRLEAAAPGHPDDAVIWESVEAQADAGAVATVSYLLFLVFAVMLAAIAVITDSSILVVGAMVVGTRVQRHRRRQRGDRAAALEPRVPEHASAGALVRVRRRRRDRRVAPDAGARLDHPGAGRRSPGRTPASSGTPTSGPSSWP